MMSSVNGDFKIQGNEKINFWNQVIKPSTECCAEKNCNDCQRGTVCKKVGSVS